MCGIYGTWNRNGTPLSIDALVDATAALRHRGPNDSGYLLVDTSSGEVVPAGDDDTAPDLGLPHVSTLRGRSFDLALGFRRLSILDISSAGHQPMCTPDGNAWLIFNGEIYNYVELRDELIARGQSFSTGSDSEVLLRAYSEWGPVCVERFVGMWAFAIWDTRKRTLFVSRDRFGIKPLFHVDSPATFTFASEAKAILAGGVPFAPSRDALASFVAFGTSPSIASRNTFFDGISSLPAASSITADAHSVRQTRYWNLPSEESDSDESAFLREYRERFLGAVGIHLRADVPLGTCLSGGLDSSSIVAAIATLIRGDQKTFSAVYDSAGRWNEREHIERVVRATGVDSRLIVPTRDALWADLDDLIWHQDEPFPTTSIFAQWCVMRLARASGVTVLLDGQGADEVLGGYDKFVQPQRVLELLARGRIASAMVMLPRAGVGAFALARAGAHALPRAWVRRASLPLYRRTIARSFLTDAFKDELRRSMHDVPPMHARYRTVDEQLRYFVAEELPHLLRYEDRNSMAFSLESRVPFLDHRLVELVFRRGNRYRLRDGWTKWLHRAAVGDLLPNEVAWRRDKVAFETPEVEWLRASRTELHRIAESGDHDLVDVAALHRGIDDLANGRGSTRSVWCAVNAIGWLNRFGRAAH